MDEDSDGKTACVRIREFEDAINDVPEFLIPKANERFEIYKETVSPFSTEVLLFDTVVASYHGITSKHKAVQPTDRYPKPKR